MVQDILSYDFYPKERSTINWKQMTDKLKYRINENHGYGARHKDISSAPLLICVSAGNPRFFSFNNQSLYSFVY
jgi:hypothetical protein